MRVSIASFLRFMTSDGKYALLVNRGQLRRGRTVLVPIGGACTVTLREGEAIMSKFGLTPADFEKAPTEEEFELRFTVADTHIDEIRRCFGQWDDGAIRELFEELVDETAILGDWDLISGGYSTEFSHTHEEIAQSNRPGKATGQATLRLCTVRDFKCGEWATRKLLRAGQPNWMQRVVRRAMGRPMQQLHFVTAAEIRAGRTTTGIEIASISKSMLDS